MSEKDLLLGDRCILFPDGYSNFETVLKERIEAGIELMELPTNIIETIICSSINKHTCVRQSPAFPNKYFVIIDEHHYRVVSLLNHLFYLFGYDVPQVDLMKMVYGILQIPYKFFQVVLLLLQTERFLLCGDVKQALSCAEVLREQNNKLDPQLMCSTEEEYGWDMILIKRIRNDRAAPYMTTFYAFHELAHIKFSLDENLKSTFLGIAKEEVNLLQAGMSLVNEEFVNPSLLPIEDIACDAYSLLNLIRFFERTGREFNVETMVESYVNAVLNQTFLDLYNEQTTDSYGWHQVCWWRMFISLEMLRVLKYPDKRLCDGIVMTRKYMRSRHAYFSEELSLLLTNQETFAKSSDEKSNMLSKNWNEQVDKTLSIIREIEYIGYK